MTQQGILLESGTNEMELLIVQIEGQFFGINVAKVQAIQQFNPQLITALPSSPQGVLGMLLYRDTTIPCIDLRHVLGLEQPEGLEREIVVVTEFNKFVSSFKVHGVEAISRCSWQEYVPLDMLFNANAYVSGTVYVDERQVLVLDLECILASLFPHMILEDVSEESLHASEEDLRDRMHIVFAEDSDILRRGVVSLLTRAGFSRITECVNGQEAYAFLCDTATSNPERMQDVVVITDIEMPRMDGLTLCKKVKQDEGMPSIPVVIFSSLINDQMIEKCKQVGAEQYVSKPEASHLIHLLDQLSQRFQNA
ncbi:MAG: chemotaxis protein [Desulfovermiculus sp.]